MKLGSLLLEETWVDGAFEGRRCLLNEFLLSGFEMGKQNQRPPVKGRKKRRRGLQRNLQRHTKSEGLEDNSTVVVAMIIREQRATLTDVPLHVNTSTMQITNNLRSTSILELSRLMNFDDRERPTI